MSEIAKLALEALVGAALSFVALYLDPLGWGKILHNPIPILFAYAIWAFLSIFIIFDFSKRIRGSNRFQKWIFVVLLLAVVYRVCSAAIVFICGAYCANPSPVSVTATEIPLAITALPTTTSTLTPAMQVRKVIEDYYSYLTEAYFATDAAVKEQLYKMAWGLLNDIERKNVYKNSFSYFVDFHSTRTYQNIQFRAIQEPIGVNSRTDISLDEYENGYLDDAQRGRTICLINKNNVEWQIITVQNSWVGCIFPDGSTQ